MPESKNFVFSYTEIAELMVRKLDLHEGFWGIYVEFGFGAANVPTSPDSTLVAPSAISIIKSVGIQRFDAPNNLTVDAAIVNPTQPGLKL
jgi:hypothetical protein